MRFTTLSGAAALLYSCASPALGLPASNGARNQPGDEVMVRKEWSTLTLAERQNYQESVTCLQNTPSVLDASYNSPSLFDDFVAVHINHTWQVHFSGYFLGWHRGFVRTYEHALQTKCGLTGGAPYWDWPKYNNRPLNQSSIFDGSQYSIGSDGKYNSSITELVVAGNLTFPPGHGGGCVAKGPFSNYTVPYRWFNFAEALTGAPPLDAWVTGQEHCLTRDLNNVIANRYDSQRNITSSLEVQTIEDFNNALDGFFGGWDIGEHGGGHAQVAGQMLDFLASPADPSFYVMHAQIDRLWTLWQAENPQARQYAIYGTQTMLNIPPSANATLEDVISWGSLSELGRDRPLSETMDVTDQWLNYRYE